MTPRVLAIGGEDTFRPLIARALLASPDSIAWVPSLDAAKRPLSAASRIQLVVLGPTVGDEQAMGVAEYLSKESPSTAVVLVRNDAVNGAFPRLVRSGIRDVVDLTNGNAELDDVLRRALDWSAGVRASQSGPEEGNAGAIVSVFSTKGGTGKTFLSCNLAAALAATLEQKVAVLDLDHDLGDVFAYFNAQPRRALQDLMDLPEGSDATAIAELGTPLPGDVIGYGSLPDPQAESLEAASVGRILSLLREAYPFVVVDGSAEYSDHVLAAFDMSDVVCLITGLDVIGARHLSMGLKTLQSLGVPRDRFRVVLNRADSKVDLDPREIERVLNVHVDARIPSSPLVARSINHGRLLWHESPRSEVARAIGDFAAGLCRQFAPDAASVDAAAGRRGFLKRS